MLLFGLVQVEANNANADDAIMLDKHGFVAETNATNIVCLELCLNCYNYKCLFSSFLIIVH